MSGMKLGQEELSYLCSVSLDLTLPKLHMLFPKISSAPPLQREKNRQQNRKLEVQKLPNIIMLHH